MHPTATESGIGGMRGGGNHLAGWPLLLQLPAALRHSAVVAVMLLQSPLLLHLLLQQPQLLQQSQQSCFSSLLQELVPNSPY